MSKSSTPKKPIFSLAQSLNGDFLEDLYQTYKTAPQNLDPSWVAFFTGYDWSHEPFEGSKIQATTIAGIRQKGHLYAHLNPLEPAPKVPEEFDSDPLKAIYCDHIGVEIPEAYESWVYAKMEEHPGVPKFSKEKKDRIQESLFKAQSLERFLHTRYLGLKRFSLEGLEALVPLLETIEEETKAQGSQEMIIGMAHRGRLNVLTHIIKKPYEELFAEFEELLELDDVKYHQGFERPGAYLAQNPSHLEAVNPVVLGRAYSRQEELGGKTKVLPVLIHGDAAFAGQGIVAECFNMHQLKDYHVGGTIHIITNNQIGFTTPREEGRSTRYASDLAKGYDVPIFHVNADEPEAVVWVGMIAAQFRQTFQKDCLIDLVGYRKYGHNETDEPSFTSPVLYQKIDKHPSVYTLYTKKMGEASETSAMETRVKDKLEAAYQKLKKEGVKAIPPHPAKVQKVPFSQMPEWTQKDMELLLDQLSQAQASFSFHPKLARLIKNRKAQVQEKSQVDWALAEAFAYGSLGLKGIKVRLSGQDVKRGTFSHRHGVFFDGKTGEAYSPMPPSVKMVNSPLSEYASLGFEFGYSVADPKALVLWEAQFGDFVNGAQIILDQFIMASEVKWHDRSSLVLLLPHGCEGMGPEHSSARVERFLQGAAQNNIQVAVPSSPAQLFHLLRQQIHQDHHRPLIILSPKSLLRHPKMVSSVSDILSGSFKPIVDDLRFKKGKQDKILFAYGKMAFELLDDQEKQPKRQVPIIRVDRLYPFSTEELKEILSRYQGPQTRLLWVQEEPQNMGAYHHIRGFFELLGLNLEYRGRKAHSSPSEGSHKAHEREQHRIIESCYDHT